MRAQEFIKEEKIGVTPKRAGRSSDRPSRGHNAEPRYKTKSLETEDVQNTTLDRLLSAVVVKK